MCDAVSNELQSHSISSRFINHIQRDNIIEDITKTYIALPSSSVQRRVLLSILSNNLTLDQINTLQNKKGVVLFTEDCLEPRSQKDSVIPGEVESLPYSFQPRPITPLSGLSIRNKPVTKRNFSADIRDANILLNG